MAIRENRRVDDVFSIYLTQADASMYEYNLDVGCRWTWADREMHLCPEKYRLYALAVGILGSRQAFLSSASQVALPPPVKVFGTCTLVS